MTDPWEGIPQELRQAVDAMVDAAVNRAALSFGKPDVWDHYDALGKTAEAALVSALRSLVSRLREAEQDAKRLDWLEAQGDAAITTRKAIDAARSSGETPTP